MDLDLDLDWAPDPDLDPDLEKNWKSGPGRLPDRNTQKSNTLAAAKHYRETLKKNQERIKEVISNRPSLLERHEQVGALKFFHLSSFY